MTLGPYSLRADVRQELGDEAKEAPVVCRGLARDSLSVRDTPLCPFLLSGKAEGPNCREDPAYRPSDARHSSSLSTFLTFTFPSPPRFRDHGLEFATTKTFGSTTRLLLPVNIGPFDNSLCQSTGTVLLELE